jgi:hypothetical protein
VTTILEAAGRIAHELERAGFDYAFSGAIALAYWSTPRATVDIDLAIDARPTALPELLAALRAAGCDIDEERALAAAHRGDFGVRIAGIRVDVFLPVLALSESAMQRRVRVAFGGEQIWIFAAEDLAVFKLLFGRTKDFADLEGLFAARRDRLDFAYIDRWVDELFSAEDPRVVRYAQLREHARDAPG